MSNGVYVQGEVWSVDKWGFKEECNTFDDRVPYVFDADDWFETENYIFNMPWTHRMAKYEGWNFNSGNYLFTTDTK